MASEPDPERLRALEKRLEQLRGKPKATRSAAAKGLSQGEVAWRMVIELSTGIVVGVGIGYGLDRLFGTLPILLAIFALLGFAAGVRVMLGTARELGMGRAPDRTGDAGDDEGD